MSRNVWLQPAQPKNSVTSRDQSPWLRVMFMAWCSGCSFADVFVFILTWKIKWNAVCYCVPISFQKSLDDHYVFFAPFFLHFFTRTCVSGTEGILVLETWSLSPFFLTQVFFVQLKRSPEECRLRVTLRATLPLFLVGRSQHGRHYFWTPWGIHMSICSLKLANFQADHPIILTFPIYLLVKSTWFWPCIPFKFVPEKSANEFEFHFTYRISDRSVQSVRGKSPEFAVRTIWMPP